jgi:hypothetical protein
MPFATLAVVQSVQPVDLVGLLAVFMGISVVLVPVIGLTARFALKPTVEALSRFFDKRGSDEAISILERRMALMEMQMEAMETTVDRVAETSDFDQKLADPREGPAQIEAPGSDE